MGVSIVNNGNGPAGNFTVKVWLTGDGLVPAPTTTPFAVWNVPGLAAGQTLSYTWNNLMFSNLGLHQYYYFVIKIDADNQVTNETNKSNNVASFSIFVYR